MIMVSTMDGAGTTPTIIWPTLTLGIIIIITAAIQLTTTTTTTTRTTAIIMVTATTSDRLWATAVDAENFLKTTTMAGLPVEDTATVKPTTTIL